MYHHQHRGKSIHSSERHMFLQGGGNGGGGDSGLVLSTDAKPRLKWTPDLHDRFVEAVNQLGGADSKFPPATLFLKSLFFILNFSWVSFSYFFCLICRGHS